MSYRNLIAYKNFCLIGDKNVGKSSWLELQLNKSFVQQYTATMHCKGVILHSFSIFTTKGPVVLNIWDLDGSDEFKTLRNNFYKSVEGFIAFFDLTNMNSYVNLKEWIEKAKEYRPESDIVLVGNKCDLENNKKISNKDTPDNFNNVIAYCKISVKKDLDTSSPILYLLRRKLGEDLDLVK